MNILNDFMKEQENKGVYNLDGPIGKKYQEFVEYWCNTVCVNLGRKFETRFYRCYECGNVPPRPESEMQKYDCVICKGRKCSIHTDINMNIKCTNCGQDNLCNDCCSFARCCKDYIDGEFVDKNKNETK